MYNDCTFIGYIGKDPEARASKKGESFTTFSIAVNKPGAANREEKPLWVNVIAFKTTAEYVNNYLKGGHRILVQGPIELQEYEGSDGKNRQSLKLIANKVVSLTPKGETAAAGATSHANSAPTQTATPAATDEDIPF